MRNSFALLCALIMTCLTGLVHATHLKGGSVTWKRDTEETDFVVKAEVIINFDLSADGLLTPIIPNETDIPKVNGHPFYKVGDTVGSGADLNWGDGTTGEALTRFVVVAVDPAAQIVTARAVEYDEDEDGVKDPGDVVLHHTYDWSSEEVDHYDLTVSASARDDGEELANRTGTTMLIRSRVTGAEENTPPAFDPEHSNLVIVDRGTTAHPKVTFQVPVATDADAGDTVKYRFIEHESDASSMSTSGDTPWELLEGMEITEAGEITWDTSMIRQTIKTYCIQVVAEDYAAGSTVAKSSTTVEFQVWVDDTTQTGVPEIEVFPATPVIYFHPDVEGHFDVIGFDHGENSRLKLIYNATEFPPGAELLPTAGFAGEGHDNGGDHLTCTLEWKPTTADLNLGKEYPMHFKFEDEDGLQSDEVTAKVKVVAAPPTPVAPLALTVTQTSFTNVPQGTLITFSATGSCATAGVPLALTTYSDIPEGAAFAAALPAQGTSSVTTTFTWQTDSQDATLTDHPIVMELVLSDAYGREEKKTVSITLLNPPAAPVITLAAGTTVPLSGTVWESLVANFTATGGSRQHPELTFEAEDVGAVGKLEMESPASNRLFWRVMPGQAQSGTLHVKVTDEWGASAVLEVPYVVGNPGAPAWWDSTINTEDVLTTATPVDFSMANGGQLKAIATRAYAKLAGEFPDIATATPEGIALAAYVSSFPASEGNYKPVVLGELKQAASLFYKAIGKLSGKGDIGFPWAAGTDDENNYSPVTVGQVKMVFSFPQPVGGLFNEPPSSVAITSPATGTSIFGSRDINVQVSASDPDGNIDRVEFYENGVLFATDSSEPYEGIFPAAPIGSHVFTAKVVDTQGLELISSAVTVEIVPSAPTSVVINSPAAGTHFPGGKAVPIQVSASDPNNDLATAYLYEGETVVQTLSVWGLSSFQMTWTQVTPGTHQLRVKVVDVDGQELTSAPVELVRDYNPPPVLSLTKPQQNQIFPIYYPPPNPMVAVVEMEATASDADGIDRVEFNVTTPTGGTLGWVCNTAPYKASWAEVTPGNYVVQAKAVDRNGGTSTEVRNITLVIPTTVTLQEGVNGYSGMTDTYLRSATGAQNTNYGADPIVRLHESAPGMVGLMKWSLSGIPATAKVVDAKITLNITNTGPDGDEGGLLWVYALKRDWSESAATWNTTGAGTTANNWEGAKDASDYDAYELGNVGLFGGLGEKTFSLNGLDAMEKVRKWISGESPNYGVKIVTENSINAHNIEMSSSEATTASQRPKLTIVYY